MIYRCEGPVFLGCPEGLDKIVVALRKLLAIRVCFYSLLQATNQLELVVNLVRLMVSLHVALFSHLNEFRENVIALCTVFWQLVVWVALKDVRACCQKVFDNLDEVSVSRQVQRCPLVESTLCVEVKCLHAFVGEKPV